MSGLSELFITKVCIVLAGLHGLLYAINEIRNPELPPAQRRAMREQCRRKGR